MNDATWTAQADAIDTGAVSLLLLIVAVAVMVARIQAGAD
jgi:hypothetical protein